MRHYEIPPQPPFYKGGIRTELLRLKPEATMNAQPEICCNNEHILAVGGRRSENEEIREAIGN